MLSRISFAASCFSVALLVAAPSVTAQTAGKIPREVINKAASDKVVLVLVGLKVPWQMESTLSQDAIAAQRAAISLVQDQVLTQLAGRKFRLVQRYQELPGLVLEAEADALAELARSENVANVILDRHGPRPAIPATADLGKHDLPRVPVGSAAQEKVPWQLFTQVMNDGTVLVLAGLKVPWQQEEKLNEELLALQRKTILDAQSYVLAELAGTYYKVMRLYSGIPGIALRVGPDALKILEKSPAVTNVLGDRLPKAAAVYAR
jgi:hypothetical protein